MTQGEDEHGQQRHEQERQRDEQNHEFDDALLGSACGAQLRGLGERYGGRDDSTGDAVSIERASIF